MREGNNARVSEHLVTDYYDRNLTKDRNLIKELSEFLRGVVIRTEHLGAKLGEERTATIACLPLTSRLPTVTVCRFKYTPEGGNKEIETSVLDYFQNGKSPMLLPG